MKTALAVMALMIACLLAADCNAEDTGRFQSLSGDYGRSVLAVLASNESQTSANNESLGTLWDWGSVPKGSVIVDGKLVEDPFSGLNTGDYSSLMKPVGVDAFTGNIIYSYQVPLTGATRYFYLDPYTKEPIFVEMGSFITESSVEKQSDAPAGSSYSLPAVFA